MNFSPRDLLSRFKRFASKTFVEGVSAGGGSPDKKKENVSRVHLGGETYKLLWAGVKVHEVRIDKTNEVVDVAGLPEVVVYVDKFEENMRKKIAGLSLPYERPDAAVEQRTRDIFSGLDPNDVEVIGQGVWRIIDPRTDQCFYIKRTAPPEIIMTHKASSFDGLPPDSNMKLPKYVGSSEALPEKFSDSFPVVEEGCNELMIVEGHQFEFDEPRAGLPPTIETVRYDHRVDESGLHIALRGKPFTQEELDGLVRDVILLSKAGIYNHDYGSNLFVERDLSGKISFYAIDFEPDTFLTRHPNRMEDIIDMQRVVKKLEAAGLTEKTYVRPEDAQVEAEGCDI